MSGQSTEQFVPKVQIQKEVYAALSEMYGREAPMYKLLLAVNRYVNELESAEHPELGITTNALNQISSERHGAIRIASPEEFTTMSRFFEVMDMFPHNAYLMTNSGAKSQPIIGTGFRTKHDPSQRMFCSTLMLNCFDEATRPRLEAALKGRNIFSLPLLTLIEKSGSDGGLSRDDADGFVKEAQNLFRWSGKGNDHELYTELKKNGEGVAADIVCFPNPHLNHLTPSSLNIDRLMKTMKEILGAKTPDQIPEDIKKLLKNVPPKEMETYLNSNGMKDTIEGPATPKPGKALVFLRQVSYKALPEKATFTKHDGSAIEATHTARFGEIEQRGVAMTPRGREVYDACLAKAEFIDNKLAQTNYEEYEKEYSKCFDALDKTHAELWKQELAYYTFHVTAKGKQAAQSKVLNDELNSNKIDKMSLLTFLYAKHYITIHPIRYDDFLPVSAAGIFASNLDITKKIIADRPKDTKEGFEKLTGVNIYDSNDGYAKHASQSRKQIITELGLNDRF